MARTQHLPWASGRAAPRRKPAARRRSSSTKRRRRRGGLRLGRGPIAILLSIVTLVLLITGLIAETMLYYLASALSGLATLAQVRLIQVEAERERREAKPRASRPNGGARPKPAAGGSPPSGPARAAGGPVKCTETGRPIEDCSCASRHVATSDGERRYGLPLGSPMGRRSKEARVPTTSRAKPIRVQPGESMRRESPRV